MFLEVIWCTEHKKRVTINSGHFLTSYWQKNDVGRSETLHIVGQPKVGWARKYFFCDQRIELPI